MTEKTFILVKPDHVPVADQILADLDEHAERVATANLDECPRDVIENHYAVHRDKFFYDNLIAHFEGRPVVLAVYQGKHIVQRFMDICGVTDPAKCGPETIRGKYGTDSLEKAIAEKRTPKNVIHRSDSISEAEREIKVWEQYLQ